MPLPTCLEARTTAHAEIGAEVSMGASGVIAIAQDMPQQEAPVA